jgi:hypothetical protein
VTVLHGKFLIIKPTRCTDFSNLFLKWNYTCFGQFFHPLSGVFTVHTAMVYVVQVCWQLVVTENHCNIRYNGFLLRLLRGELVGMTVVSSITGFHILRLYWEWGQCLLSSRTLCKMTDIIIISFQRITATFGQQSVVSSDTDLTVVFLFWSLVGSFFFFRKCRVFRGLIHVLQLPVLRGWNPPCDYWVVGLWFAITVPAFNFSGCRWIHQFWSARISIEMPVPRFMSVFCCSRTTFNVCSSLLTFFGPMKEVTVDKQEWCQSYPYQARFCKG